jgi:NTP pyrophosphatase (non-canonical NTP hydrolase)
LINLSQSITGWQKRCAGYAVESGFRTHDWPASRENVAVFLINLHSEISELWEAFREGRLHQVCDKAGKLNDLGLPVLTCAEEELADIFIRLMDTAEALGVDMPRAIAAKHVYNSQRAFQHGGKLA